MKFYFALVQKIKNTLETTTRTSETIFRNCASLRAFEPSDFEYLVSTEIAHEDFINKEEISIQLNSMSAPNAPWDIDTNRNLFSAYSNAIERLKLKDRDDYVVSDANEIRILYTDQNEKNEKYKRYLKFLEDHDNLVEEKISLMDDQDEMEEDIYRSKLAVINRKLSILLADWETIGHKHEVESALAKINEVSGYDAFLANLEDVREKLRSAGQTGLASQSEYSALYLSPLKFHKNDDSWSDLSMSKSEIPKLFKEAESELLAIGDGPMDIEYDETYIESISLKYCVVDIRRQWLDEPLLNSEYIQKRPAPLELLYARKIILIKDLSIMLSKAGIKKVKSSKAPLQFRTLGLVFNSTVKMESAKHAMIKPVSNLKFHKLAAKSMAKIVAKAPAQFLRANTVTATIPTVSAAAPATTGRRGGGAGGKKPKRPLANLRAKFSPKFSMSAVTHKLYTGVVQQKPKKKQSNIHFEILDSFQNDGIEDVDISLESKNSSFFTEVTTDDSGRVTLALEAGRYNMVIRKNGYSEVNEVIDIKSNSNKTVKKKLEPKEIIYDSYFLIGVLGKKISI